MNGRKLLFTAISAVAALAFSGCEKIISDKNPVAEKELIIYSCGHNNLSKSLWEDICEIAASSPYEAQSEEYKILVFCHTAATRDYSKPSDPVLMQVFRNPEGAVVMDTLSVYPASEGYTGSDAVLLEKVLRKIKAEHPAKEYGFLFSSHATGWLPYRYYSTEKITKSVGSDYTGDGTVGTAHEMELTDYAAAFRNANFKVKYMLMDACYMGGIEAAYELRDVCDYYVASQTEIWSDGLVYTTMLDNLFGNDTLIGLAALCNDYMTYYKSINKEATISLVSTSELTSLALTCRALNDKYRTQINTMDISQVQVFKPAKYTAGYDRMNYFFDLEDVYITAGINNEEKQVLKNALKACVLFEGATDRLFDGTTIKNHCGLSMFIPSRKKADLNEYYKRYMWNKDVVLVQ